MKRALLLGLVGLSYQILIAQNIAYHRLDEKHVYTSGSPRHVNYFPDSVRIELVDHNTLVVVEGKNFHHALATIGELKQTLSDLAEQVEASYKIGKHDRSYRVHVGLDLNGMREIVVEDPGTSQSKVLVKDKDIVQLLPPGWEVFIHYPAYKVYVYVQDLPALKAIAAGDFEKVRESLQESQTFYLGRKSVKSRFIIRNGSIEYKDIRYYHPLDLIGLSFSAGAGVLRNRVYPELMGTLAFSFADRFNRKNHKVELSYSSMYFAQDRPEGKFSGSISSFVSLSYSKNFSWNPNEHSWFGIGAGYLVQKAGDFDFFNGKTMRFFLISTPGGGQFHINPEIYLTDDFKKTVFGLKLQYNF